MWRELVIALPSTAARSTELTPRPVAAAATPPRTRSNVKWSLQRTALLGYLTYSEPVMSVVAVQAVVRTV